MPLQGLETKGHTGADGHTNSHCRLRHTFCSLYQEQQNNRGENVQIPDFKKVQKPRHLNGTKSGGERGFGLRPECQLVDEAPSPKRPFP